MPLSAGLRTNSRTELPNTYEFIARVESIDIRDGFSDMMEGKLNFEWELGTPIYDEDASNNEEDHSQSPVVLMSNDVMVNVVHDTVVFNKNDNAKTKK